MKITALNHVALQVKDVIRTEAFYVGVLGLEILPRPAAFTFPGAWYRIGPRQELHIIQGPPDAPDGSFSRRGNHFSMTVEAITDVEAHLKSRGIAYTGPHHRPDGAKQIFCSDPDGHVVEFTEGP